MSKIESATKEVNAVKKLLIDLIQTAHTGWVVIIVIITGLMWGDIIDKPAWASNVKRSMFAIQQQIGNLTDINRSGIVDFNKTIKDIRDTQNRQQLQIDARDKRDNSIDQSLKNLLEKFDDNSRP